MEELKSSRKATKNKDISRFQASRYIRKAGQINNYFYVVAGGVPPENRMPCRFKEY